MVLGRAGLRLEAQKFALYLMIPITASLAYNEPAIQRWSADYFQFMKYPSNPQTNLKEEFEQIRKEREEEIKQQEKNKESRKVYLQQLKELNAVRSPTETPDTHTNDKKKEWFGWLKWRRGSDAVSSTKS